MGKIKVTTDCNGIEGLKVIEPAVFGDERGYFMETYNYNDFKEAGIDCEFVQDNQSSSKKILAIIIINFGGLSIFTQIKSILEDTNLNFINYFKGRILQIIISLLLCSTI